jgi:predicted transposase YdaD
MQEYDKGSKWLIQHHGDSMLRLAGVPAIAEWRPLQAELVQHRRLPDGLIEAFHEGDERPDHYLLEVVTYPDARVVMQVTRDAALVLLDRDILPEVVVMFLRPRGNVEAASVATLRSRRGFASWPLSWKVVRLWEIPAQELLAVGDIGLIPWVPLSHIDGPPEPTLYECRDQIDRVATPTERENLMAITQVFARLRYNDERLFQLFGGHKAMIESPVIQEIIADCERETRRKDIVNFLQARFGEAARAVQSELEAIEGAKLDELLRLAATCRSLASFRKKLSS